MTPRLWLASLVVCGLFVAEDPTVVAVRNHLGRSSGERLAVDLTLAASMVAYNFAGSRYVVSVASRASILDAIAEVDAHRGERISSIRSPLLRTVRRAIAHLNPFDLIKVAGDRLGRTLNRASGSARLRRRRRTSALLEDIGAVNLLGVPGASLAIGTSGHGMTRLHSLRHCVLFVASWFVGANVIEWLVGRAHELPLVGPGAAALTGAIGATFSLLTDITRPPGAITIASMTVVIVRYTTQVEHVIRTHRRTRSAPGDLPGLMSS